MEGAGNTAVEEAGSTAVEGGGNIAVEGAVSGGNSGTLASGGSLQVWGVAADIAVRGVGIAALEAVEVILEVAVQFDRCRHLDSQVHPTVVVG